MKFLRISFNISELLGKMIFPQFLCCSCEVILPSFAYQDGGFHVTTFSTLNANILRTRSDIEKWSMVFFPILLDLTPEMNIFLGELSLYSSGKY